MSAQAPPDTAIHVEGVGKRYGGVDVLRGISLDVNRGEFFGILGPNGAGKTTFIEIMEGLRKPDTGTVSVLGYSPWPRNRALLARVGVQTQASAFFIRLTAREHLETVAALYGVGGHEVSDALTRVGLTEKRDTQVEKLSGGQRQRLAIAAALMHRPELLFLDEPTAALDPRARRELWDLLREIRAEGRTIIYTTHHLDEAEALCDRVAILDQGGIAALDSPATLVKSLDAPTRVLIPAGVLSAADARTTDGVEDVSSGNDSLVLTTHSVSKVLAALGQRVSLDGIQTRAATLEDVYLHLTGKEYEG